MRLKHKHSYVFATTLSRNRIINLDWKFCDLCGKIRPKDLKKYNKYADENPSHNRAQLIPE